MLGSLLLFVTSINGINAINDKRELKMGHVSLTTPTQGSISLAVR